MLSADSAHDPDRTTPMRTLLAIVVCATAVTGCSMTATTVEQGELEKQVASIYEPDDPADKISATCDGELDAEVDATQDCNVTVGEENADVHVVVTKVDGSDVEFETQTFVPAERLADTLKTQLADQGFEVETVECDGELVGEVDATVECTAAPAKGDGVLEVTVTEVDGLMINFNYKSVR